jgi:hypothetical protein
MDWICHGDVQVKPSSIPKNAKKINTDILQHGEATGHAHRLYGDKFTVYETPEKQKYLKLVKPVALRHEEHKEIVIAPGTYRIDITREYDHFEEEARKVID